MSRAICPIFANCSKRSACGRSLLNSTSTSRRSPISDSRDLDDRSLWNRCQQDGWVLFTDNRNQEDENSLQATLMDSWQMGHLPVLTLANKGRFENSAAYAKRVATDVAELVFGIAQEEYRDRPRIYVPR
jgi:hypothetical protein